MAEHSAVNRNVGGSIPPGRAYSRVAQWTRARDFESRCWRFESSHGCLCVMNRHRPISTAGENCRTEIPAGVLRAQGAKRKISCRSSHFAS